jgi:hypothetical protein
VHRLLKTAECSLLFVSKYSPETGCPIELFRVELPALEYPPPLSLTVQSSELVDGALRLAARTIKLSNAIRNRKVFISISSGSAG